MAGKFNTQTLGAIAETEACVFLEKQGLRLIQKNYRSPCGEIDLIMQDKTAIVFVEVRLRSAKTYGSATESVNLSKQRKLIKTALLFLQKKCWLNKVNARFDIIGIDTSKKIEWIQNAFSATP